MIKSIIPVGCFCSNQNSENEANKWESEVKYSRKMLGRKMIGNTQMKIVKISGKAPRWNHLAGVK